MELEKGMYARTENGIKEILEYEYDDEYENGHKIHFKGDKYGMLYTEEELPKASHNIIDLIEVGDYVNGKQVIRINTDYIFDYSEEILLIYFSENDYIYSKTDIKSIVTKEQFGSMSYKVGE